MADYSRKVQQNRLRRAAQRQGLDLVVSRRRDPRALDFGRAWLLDGSRIAVGDVRRGATLDEIERYLLGEADT